LVSLAQQTEIVMKHLFSMIGIGVCAVLFAACAMEPSDSDDTGQEAALSAVEPAVADIPAGATSIDSTPTASGITCVSFHAPGGNSGVCPSGSTCLWANDGRAGDLIAVSRGCFIADLTKVPCTACKGPTFNDSMSSWENASGAQSCWWFNINRGGTAVTMPNGVTHNSTAAGNNDQASSFGSC
jgi:hypothetical protein